jgi:hypothetical protein
MTYRQLLEAIKTARELEDALEMARSNPKRLYGTPEEQDNANALMRQAGNALDQEIELL